MKRRGMTFILFLSVLHSPLTAAETSQLSLNDGIAQCQEYKEAYKQYSQAVIEAQAQQKQQIEKYNKQMAVVEAQGKQQQELLEKSKAIITQQEAVVAKQAALQDRFSKILDVWEQQQQQYQKYLNSLSPK